MEAQTNVDEDFSTIWAAKKLRIVPRRLCLQAYQLTLSLERRILTRG